MTVFFAQRLPRANDHAIRVEGGLIRASYDSTAIPGIRAKPVIDMLAVTTDVTLLDESVTRWLDAAEAPDS